MADSKASKATARSAAKTPPSPQDTQPTTVTAPVSAPAPAPVPEATTKDTDPLADVQRRAMARAAQPTPAIAGVTAPAGPSSLLGTPVAPQQVRKPEPFLSEGMRNDLQDLGYAIDPVSGARFDRDPVSGDVTMRERVAADAPAVVSQNYGQPTPIDVAFAPQPAVNDTDKAENLTSNPLVAEQEVAPPDQPAERTEHTSQPTNRLTELDTGETLSYDTRTGVTTAHDTETGETRVVSEEELRQAQAAQDGED